MAHLSKPLPTQFTKKQIAFLVSHFEFSNDVLEDISAYWEALAKDKSERLFRYPAILCREMQHFCTRLVRNLQTTPIRLSDVYRVGEQLSDHFYGRYLSLGEIANRTFSNGGFSYDNIRDCYESWRNEIGRNSVEECNLSYCSVADACNDLHHHNFMSLFLIDTTITSPDFRDLKEMLTPEIKAFEDTLTDREIEMLELEVQREPIEDLSEEEDSEVDEEEESDENEDEDDEDETTDDEFVDDVREVLDEITSLLPRNRDHPTDDSDDFMAQLEKAKPLERLASVESGEESYYESEDETYIPPVLEYIPLEDGEFTLFEHSFDCNPVQLWHLRNIIHNEYYLDEIQFE
ncbi:unnamed protein product [Caenorhabditis sp. 36 PRJEB53466]|nr:unnamed protein product [Caenorhabditis sp. 36 PRJEB53466]